MNTYTLVYDAGEFDPSKWGFLAVPIGLMVVGLLLIRFRGKPRVTWFSNWPPSPLFAWFFFLFATVLTLIVSTLAVSEWLEVQTALSHKHYHLATGMVEAFQPMPEGGHGEESFRLNGIHFHYSSFEVGPGYQKTEPYGGVIHKDSVVRIGYICKPSETDCSDPLIVRLEVRGK